jgi:2-C-methyl-D-erythritol 4-phosphate cytidylyltransferase/2-C-methyl-D-erythritol 2,4-cyclodiphosphate synthase
MAGRVAALLVAAGSGSRFGGETPKQYALLGGRPVLRRALDAFSATAELRLVVIAPGQEALYEAAVAGLDLPAPVPGGATRQDSVRAGLESLAGLGWGEDDIVLIHDAARPLVPRAVIDGVLTALAKAQAAYPARPVRDTLRRGLEPVARDGLVQAETPQGFRFGPILAAHRAAPSGATDDIALAAAAGLEVAASPGSSRNFKLTEAEDMILAEALLAAGRETRTGLGYDVHRFGPGTAVTLGGVSIPHERGLEGHSDADVGLHALTDALLGALAEGDIGAHFPPSEARWKGADSAVFLKFAGDRVRARGGEIVNLDLTFICEAPKIGPHRDAMRARIGDILGIAPPRVAVKATTSEGLGFTGRREGIAAQALATIRLNSED